MTDSSRMSKNNHNEFKRQIAYELSSIALANDKPNQDYSPAYDAPLTDCVLDLLRPCEAWTVRNSQGWEVMVTPNTLPMVDLDFKDHPQLQSLAHDPPALLKQLMEKHQNLRFPPSLRVYRTRGGIRMLVESAKWYPRSGEFEKLAKTLGCDEQYLSLSQQRNSYRIRLTPKAGGSPGRRKVCDFIGSLPGNPWMPREADWLIGIHDERTGAFRKGNDALG